MPHKFQIGEPAKGAPGTFHEPLRGVVEWVRGNSVRVRWSGGGSLMGPAGIFDPVR